MFKTYPDQLENERQRVANFWCHHPVCATPQEPTILQHEPVHVQEIDGAFVSLKPELTTGIQKQIEIRFINNDPEVHQS